MSWEGGKPLTWDITVASTPLGQSCIHASSHTSHTVGGAAELAASLETLDILVPPQRLTCVELFAKSCIKLPFWATLCAHQSQYKRFIRTF